MSTFGQREVIKAVCNALPSGGRVDHVRDLVDGFLRSEHVLPVRVGDRAAAIHRQDGAVVAARTDEYRWTTPEMLEAETRLLASALARRATGAGIADEATIQTAIESRRTLAAEQTRMVRAICSSGDGVEIVEGVAGAGKTFALAAARDAWSASGYEVIGRALAARAAKQLEDDAGIPGSTIDRLHAGIDRHTTTLDDRTVLVVDEAAMVGTRKLARLLTHAQAAGAKVVLVVIPVSSPRSKPAALSLDCSSDSARVTSPTTAARPTHGNEPHSPSSEPATPTRPSTTTSTTTAFTRVRPTRLASGTSTRG